MSWKSIVLTIFCLSKLCFALECRGLDCNKFKCSSEPFPVKHIDPYLRPGSTFMIPCSCLPDWNDIFCNLTQYLNFTPQTTSIEYPTVCICRKFSDHNSKCEQFISRCFKQKNNECACCFNQPHQYCNQLSCKNNEPNFHGTNTTCMCHHNPTDYPYQICKTTLSKDDVRLQSGSPSEINQSKHITLLGWTLPVSVFLYIIVGVLFAVAVFTIIILITGNRRLSRHREEINRQMLTAQEALLTQRAEDDRYLPTV